MKKASSNKTILNTKFYLFDTKTKGRSLTANKKFRKGEFMDSCPILIFNDFDTDFYRNTLLMRYFFVYERNLVYKPEKITYCIALGSISMCNHSFEPNCYFFIQRDVNIIHLIALHDILKDDPLTINYDYDADVFREMIG